MAMDKYATYYVFMNKQTHEIKRVLLDELLEFEKTAEISDWECLDTEPDKKDETERNS